MKINKILVEVSVQEKILWKHGIKRDELETALLEGNPRFFTIKKNLYMAVAHYRQYVTVIFEYARQNATIRTAYHSSDRQIRKYKRK